MKGTIRAEEVDACLLCGGKGKTLYNGLRDQNYGTPGLWNFYHCSQCNLVWLSPRPAVEDMFKFYPSCYGTHAIPQKKAVERLKQELWLAVIAKSFGYGELLIKNTRRRAIGWLLNTVPPIREMARGQVMWLHGNSKGKLLDIGCGNGDFLAAMRHLGWEIYGVDTDFEVVKLAQANLQAPIFAGTLAQANYPQDFFDAITLRHTIEHIYDPIETLTECRRVLNPRGKLVVVTPNIESLGHKMFHGVWSQLDPPRHLFLFSRQSLRDCALLAGLQIITLRTTPRTAYWWWATSRLRRHTQIFFGGTANWRLLIESIAFQVAEEALHLCWRGVGEEVILIATKPRDESGIAGIQDKAKELS